MLAAVALTRVAFAADAAKDFSDLDPNYKDQPVVLDGLVWRNGFRAPFVVDGAPYANADGSRTRFPLAVAPKMRCARNYEVMARQCAGMCVRFRTTADRISFKATFGEFYVNKKIVMAGSGFDLYRNGKWFKNAQPDLDFRDGGVFEMSFKHLNWGSSRKDGNEFALYLPLQCGIVALSVGVPEGVEMLPPKPHAVGDGRPIVFFGSSIVHAAACSRPGLEHCARVGRFLDAEIVNMGFCGSCQGDLAAADAICSIDPLALVMEYDDNAPTPDFLDRTHAPFFKRIRALKPNLPVLIMTSPCPLFGERSRMCIARTWLEAKDAGDLNVDFIDTRALFDPCEDVNDCFMDGGHQNDLGGDLMSRAIAGRLRRMLGL